MFNHNQIFQQNNELILFKLQHSDSIYSQRKDVITIKQKLISKNLNEKYWKTLCKYLNGHCSKTEFDEVMDNTLVTQELRKLHNELISAILFNIHYSSLPPPETNISPLCHHAINMPHPNLLSLSNDSYKFFSFSSSASGHLPSYDQLLDCIKSSLRKFHDFLPPNENTVTLIHHYCIQFITTIIKKASQSIPSKSHDSDRYLSLSMISSVLNNNPKFTTVISNQVLSKLQL